MMPWDNDEVIHGVAVVASDGTRITAVMAVFTIEEDAASYAAFLSRNGKHYVTRQATWRREPPG